MFSEYGLLFTVTVEHTIEVRPNRPQPCWPVWHTCKGYIMLPIGIKVSVCFSGSYEIKLRWMHDKRWIKAPLIHNLKIQHRQLCFKWISYFRLTFWDFYMCSAPRAGNDGNETRVAGEPQYKLYFKPIWVMHTLTWWPWRWESGQKSEQSGRFRQPFKQTRI